MSIHNGIPVNPQFQLNQPNHPVGALHQQAQRAMYGTTMALSNAPHYGVTHATTNWGPPRGWRDYDKAIARVDLDNDREYCKEWEDLRNAVEAQQQLAAIEGKVMRA